MNFNLPKPAVDTLFKKRSNKNLSKNIEKFEEKFLKTINDFMPVFLENEAIDLKNEYMQKFIEKRDDYIKKNRKEFEQSIIDKLTLTKHIIDDCFLSNPNISFEMKAEFGILAFDKYQTYFILGNNDYNSLNITILHEKINFGITFAIQKNRVQKIYIGAENKKMHDFTPILEANKDILFSPDVMQVIMKIYRINKILSNPYTQLVHTPYLSEYTAHFKNKVFIDEDTLVKEMNEVNDMFLLQHEIKIK